MAGEEIKALGANEYTDDGSLNPLYYRGLPRNKLQEPTPAPEMDTDILRFLCIVALTLVIGYLTLGPLILLLAL